MHYDDTNLSYHEVKRNREEEYLSDNVKNSQMYQHNKNVIPENCYNNNQKHNLVNYGVYQDYDDDGFRNDRTIHPPQEAQNVVVNLDATGNSVNTVLRWESISLSFFFKGKKKGLKKSFSINRE